MSIDLDAIEARIATGIYGDDRMSKEERNDAFSALAEIIAEVSDLRQTLDATEKERDQWHDAALDRRQALSDADATLTGVYFALIPEGGVNGWRPSRGVDALIDLALTVREDAEEAEKGARACDQIVALLDGIPIEAPCPEAARVAALLSEIERLRADLDALSRAVGQALVAASLAAGETLADPIPHIIVSTVTRLRAEAQAERAAVVAWLRAAPTARMWQQAPMDDAADHIERGEHRREEER